MDQLVLLLLQYGQAPALLVLTFAIGFLARKITELENKNATQIRELLEKVKEDIAALERSLHLKIGKMDEMMEELTRRITVIERDYLPRLEHYRDFSGWREEIHRVVDRLDRLAERKDA